ncbi:GNAT family N-acetyltransferase [Candidatus Rhabdochlamydia sp. T3358]|jgi:RimJ/RimL family protein N-acetyltransferase|uniref:GNAT family N-acetyltransferase n=1 Tax=Candidatus Rhabdochlamydia sp. T3358 TaxID=2099795 RepID=UPI0010B761C6|nr:GNAT family N-acetyltransferase [Candidatus Rhabdochlamydia sp. T3358]VHO04206.1 Spermidine N(1)-acetyltransferase [Candidatus Rhabdochlamydia sp. T3358]
MQENIIQTERLILRPWKKEDLACLQSLNQDPRVMEYFPSLKSYKESLEEYNRIVEDFKKEGFGLWAVSIIGGADFIGFIGLHRVKFTAHFTPAVEIAWRLMADYWGKGYATEGAIACLKYGFETLNLNEIVSFTTTTNKRSIAVMERIGMSRDPKDDFDHPKLAEGHPLRRHVLYRLQANEWKRRHIYSTDAGPNR